MSMLDALRQQAMSGVQQGEGNATVGNKANPLDYVSSIRYLLGSISPTEPADIVVSFGNDIPGAINAEALSYVLNLATNVRSIKVNCNATAAGVSLQNFAHITNQDTVLQTVDFSGAEGILKPTTMSKSFYYRAGLREILGEIDMSVCTNCVNTFTPCYSLETIRFKAGTISISISIGHSSKLSDESIQSIIDGLKDMTGGTAQTLTLHADVGAKLTDAQKAAASAKNWTISY